MYKIFHGDLYIGDTDLAKGGDAPMGCAEGEFQPTKDFVKFRTSVPPQIQNEPDYKIWNGLILKMEDGRRVQCIDVVLHLFEFDENDIEILVDALGVSEPSYATLFPQHVEAYESQFRA
ncbi:hypothetical protein [Pseudooceanicola antarcticus]|uniref:hypothetical protein n=1 Tax=Pseudooceanicola antarcticus TaxID=1247613 RepID=UPI00117AAF70|nr:hypothetical protein [Pseudooceanicola antarcticus]